MLRHLAWFMLRLAAKTGSRGRAPKRKLVAATVLHMAFKRGRPEVWDTQKCFTGSHGLLNWAYHYPKHGEQAPGRVDFYGAVHSALGPDALDPRLLEHLQVETFKQFATQTNGRDRNGRPVLKHPKAGVALVADGSFTEGQAQQTPVYDEEHRQIRVRHRDDLDGVRFTTYGSNGSFTRSVVGYKLVALVDVVSARAVITATVPSNAHEPDVVLYLLERLFELWPEAPTALLVGDGLFGHSIAFLRELLFRFGIDPVFPWRADYPDDKFDKGVPVCKCTDKDRPMRLFQRKGKWWGPTQRLAGDLARGAWVPQADLRVRYEFCCPEADSRGQNGGCANQTTYPWDDPRIHTYLPHAAVQDKYASKHSQRRVLLWQRNVVESFYAALQRLGMQGRGAERPAWANDVEVHWMLGLGALFLTARRLVFENGLYARAQEEAEALHLLDDCTRDAPAPAPTRAELDAADGRRARELGKVAPPASWVRACGQVVEPFSGSGAAWASECSIELAEPYEVLVREDPLQSPPVDDPDEEPSQTGDPDSTVQ